MNSRIVYSTGLGSLCPNCRRPVRVSAAYTTASLAETLGVRPALGRYFNTDEDVTGDPRAVVLSHDLWQRAFGAEDRRFARTNIDST